MGNSQIMVTLLSMSNYDEADCRRITEEIWYDESIGRSYRGWSLGTEMLDPFIREPGRDWAIVPKWSGKSISVPFFRRSGAGLALKDDKVGVDSGCALAFKRIICFHAEGIPWYDTHYPNLQGWNVCKRSGLRFPEIWGDYYYAGYFACIDYAVSRGCDRISFFPCRDGLRKWQWIAFIRAAQNVLHLRRNLRGGNIKVCCMEGLPDEYQKEESLPILPHRDLPLHRIEPYLGSNGVCMDLIRFKPTRSIRIGR